jgi:hypothetical protein
MIAAAALEVEEAPDVAVAFIMRSSIDPLVLFNLSSRSWVKMVNSIGGEEVEAYMISRKDRQIP